MSEQQLNQMLYQIQTQEDLEDFMAYYQFDNKEKQKVRAEWMESQSQAQDRGLGKVLLAGIGTVVGYKALKRIFGKRGGRKQQWQPGMGGVKRSVPTGQYGQQGYPNQFQQSFGCGDGYGCQPAYQQQQPYPNQQYQQQQSSWYWPRICIIPNNSPMFVGSPRIMRAQNSFKQLII